MTHTYIYIYIYIHTHTHTHTHMLCSPRLNVVPSQCDVLILMCVIPAVLIQYVTIRYVKTNVLIEHCTVVIQKATYFSCARQPLSGFMFQKCTQEIHVAVAIQNKVSCIDSLSYCYVLCL